MQRGEPPEVAVATIEGIIQRNTITFDTLITTANFNTAWNQHSEVVMDYLVQHIREVCEIGFMMKKNVHSTPHLICLNILQSKDTVFYEKMFNSKEFCDLIMGFTDNIVLSSAKTQMLFYDTLTMFLSSTNFSLFRRIDSKQFFKGICAKLYHDTPARFIQAMTITLTPSTFIVLRESKLCSLLTDEYLRNTRSGTTALRLMQNCFINEFFLKHAGETFSDSLLLNELRKTSFSRKDTHGIDFLRGLYTASIPFPNSPQWGRIAIDLVKDLPSISKTLVDCKNFGLYENSLGKLFITLTDGIKSVDSLGFETVCKSVDLFFLSPVNSFVHNFTVACVRVLSENRGDVSELIRRTKLPARIIELYSNREKDATHCYWGQLRLISDFIEPFVERSEYSKWDSVVQKANEETRKILEIPEIETHAMVPTKPPSTMFLCLHRLPKKKRYIFLIGVVSLFLFIYVALFV